MVLDVSGFNKPRIHDEVGVIHKDGERRWKVDMTGGLLKIL